MDFILEDKKCELMILEATHTYLSEEAIYRVNLLSNVFTEDAEKSFVTKVKDFFDKLIDAIVDFIRSLSDKIQEFLNNKDAKKKLEELEKCEFTNEKVTIYSSDEKKALLDEYIRELTKLEREVMNVKGVIYATKNEGKRQLAVIEYQRLSKKLDELNVKYDKKFLDDNKDTIEMAAKDAIRFTKKSLDNVKVDYNQIEKDSKEILVKFKKDADGCDVVEKSNLLTKIGSSLATNIRKFELLTVKYKKANLISTLALGAAIGIGATVMKNKVVGELKKKGEEFMKQNPEKFNELKNKMAK